MFTLSIQIINVDVRIVDDIVDLRQVGPALSIFFGEVTSFSGDAPFGAANADCLVPQAAQRCKQRIGNMFLIE